MDTTIIIVGIIAIALLAYIAYRLTNIKFYFRKRFNQHTYEELVLKQERLFFLKYANLNSEFRTVTINEAIFQALETSNLVSNLGLRTGEKVEALNFVKNGASENGSATLNIAEARAAESNFNIEEECPPSKIDRDQLIRNNAEYEAYLASLIGRENLNKLCPCPGVKGGYCIWEVSMFQRFIVDLEKWRNLSSIQIINCTPDENGEQGQILSSYTLGSILHSPTGNFAVLEMTNPGALQNLAPGTHIKVVFKWQIIVNGVVEERCIILRNIIPNSVPKSNVQVPEETTV